MEVISKDELTSLAHQLMFDLSDEEATQLQGDFKDLMDQIALLDRIDTTDVKEMVYPFEAETSYLREDVVDHVISQKEALANAQSVMAGHIHVPKVVK